MTKTISVKELRQNFPQIRRELARGVIFEIIYRSQPVAWLKPLSRPHLPWLRTTNRRRRPKSEALKAIR